MNDHVKSSWCRGPDCRYHPNPIRLLFLMIYRLNFSERRCLSCKRFVQKDYYKQR